MIGRVVLGRYRIVSELARGGMGVVYLARTEGASGFVKPVVIKLVLPQHAADARFLGMFVREAQILSDLRHPSIVAVLDFGQEGDAYVMALEYIRGYHLGQWNRFRKKTKRGIPTDVVMLWTIDVLEALHKAHGMTHPDGTSMHIVHRDVSPSNILLDEDGRARLLDFGVARMRGENVNYQTQIQSFVGKFSYGAPELLGGADASPRSDLYSCAVVLHEQLFGRNTFFGAEDALTLARVSGHIPELIEGLCPDAPRGLDDVLQTALQKDPGKRYANAWDFAAALRALLPRGEDEIRGHIATMLKSDFGDEIAKVLGVESLAQRDQTWREYGSESEPPAERTIMLDIDNIEDSVAPVLTPADPASHVRASSRQLAGPGGHIMRGAATATGRLSIPEPPAPSMVSAAYPAAPPMPPARAQWAGWMAAVAVVTCLVAAALYLALRPPAPPPAPARVIHLEPKPDPAAAAREAAAAEEARLKAEAELRASILGAHQERIDKCFARARGEVPADLELHFEVEPSGKVSQAEVLPEQVAKTALGRCLRGVGKSTRFPPTDSEQLFSIPVRSGR